MNTLASGTSLVICSVPVVGAAAAGSGAGDAAGAADFAAAVPFARGDDVGAGLDDGDAGVEGGVLSRVAVVGAAGVRSGKLKKTAAPIAAKTTIAAPEMIATRADPGTPGVYRNFAHVAGLVDRTDDRVRRRRTTQ